MDFVSVRIVNFCVKAAQKPIPLWGTTLDIHFLCKLGNTKTTIHHILATIFFSNLDFATGKGLLSKIS